MYKERLKFFREKEDMKQKTLAYHIGVEASHYRHLESEDEIMPLKHLNSVSNYYNISLDYLFELTSTKQYKNPNKDIIKEESGKRLKEIRKELNLTQSKLANLLNTTQSVIADYERGRYLIATGFLYTICSKYKVSADYLVGKIDSPKYLD